ncbi:ABC transporter ATP-binding protein [Kitasatospora xanthocidica]|uniref:ATP-binding cassette domain-containing protein n=1 Tax=Kitasatospora xanthocidica TaxID=83382 RepID=UPI00167A7A26|nr:ATP-binding cassette domain-containing protein [Kitasatospora xanthocidica]GHF68401.1 ABC transporter ATP-binding protein [Kitasatospora xanthocidica]
MAADTVIDCAGLGRRYRRTWALRDCRLAVPAGHVVALVGPNGAGKSTLLGLAAGLTLPTEGAITVLGDQVPGSPRALDRIGFVAQNAALYPGLRVRDLLAMGRHLNRRWDDARARAHLDGLGIPRDRRYGRLSGGQQAQVSLALALAKRPELLLLDEPLAALDPLARHDFMAVLLTAVAEDGLSVVFSSHAVNELRQSCDYLVVLGGGRVQVAGEVDDLLGGHRMLTGPTAEADRVADRLPVVRDRRAGAQSHLLVRTGGVDAPVSDGWRQQRVGLEELVLAYLREPTASALPGPRGAVRPNEKVLLP